MTTITKEWLQQTIAEFENTRDDIPFGLSDDDAKILIVLKRALAVIDAEPVRYLNKFSGTCVTLEQQSNAADDVAVYIPLYAAPPAPVVPEDLRSSFEAAARLNNEMYRWTSCMSYNGSYVGEPEGLLKRNIREIEHIMDSCRAAMLQGAEPVSQTYKLPELIEGMEVSIDVSTCDADAGNRYFGTVTEVSELDTAKNGYILLVQDAKPNFDVNGNSPVTPDGWISCSERMPEDEQEVIVHNKLGYRYVSYFDEHSGLFFDMRGGNQMNCIEHILVTHWMPLPAAPKPEINNE